MYYIKRAQYNTQHIENLYKHILYLIFAPIPGIYYTNNILMMVMISLKFFAIYKKLFDLILFGN